MFKKLLIINIVILCFSASKLYTFEKDAQLLVQSTTDNAKRIILDSNIALEDKKKKIEKIALDVVDVDGLGRFTLGAFRSNLNEEQLSKYIKIFRIFFA